MRDAHFCGRSHRSQTKMAKILVVEDDINLQKTLLDYLKRENFETLGASNGEDGIILAKKEKPDLILLDIVLPRKNGYEVIKELKSDDNASRIPIVLLTNLGSSNDVEKALNLGATTYLVKADYKLEEIIAKIKEILKIN